MIKKFVLALLMTGNRIYFFAKKRKLTSLGCNFTIKTHMTESERIKLFELVLSCGNEPIGVEIGSYKGASSVFLAAALSRLHGTLLCIDTWNNETMPEGESDTYNIFLENTHAFADIIKPLRMNSYHMSSLDIPDKIAIAFIDGDHSYEGAKNDFNLLCTNVKPGGFLVFHDAICFPGVTRVIGEALSTGAWKLAGLVDNLLWMQKW